MECLAVVGWARVIMTPIFAVEDEFGVLYEEMIDPVNKHHVTNAHHLGSTEAVISRGTD
jgi:hypothetical protein